MKLLFLLLCFLPFKWANASIEMRALVAGTHISNGDVVLDNETLTCHNLGNEICLYGTCTAVGRYQSSGGPGKSVFAIAVALKDETCQGHQLTVTELASWD